MAERTSSASVSSGREDGFRPAFRRGLILTDKSRYGEGLACRDMADGALVIVIGALARRTRPAIRGPGCVS